MALGLLGLAVTGSLLRPSWLPLWLVPLLAFGVAWATGTLGIDQMREGTLPLIEPLLFLTAAVPFASLLDKLGFFGAAAAHLVRAGSSAAGLW